MYKFLAQDLDRLQQEIDSLTGRIKEIGKDMGVSCQEGAETFHDNFAYEQGDRDQRMWSQRRRELNKLKNHATVVNAGPQGSIGIGRTFTVKEGETNELHTWRIGSYVTFQDEDISYATPLAKLLIGAKVGEMRKGTIGGRVVTYTVINIS